MLITSWRAPLLNYLREVAAQKKHLPLAFRIYRGIMSLEKKYGLASWPLNSLWKTVMMPSVTRLSPMPCLTGLYTHHTASNSLVKASVR